MNGKRYTEELKVAAVKQVFGRGHPAAEVTERLSVSIHSIYTSTKLYACQTSSAKLKMVPSMSRRGTVTKTLSLKAFFSSKTRAHQAQDIRNKRRYTLG
ncbi:transposase [Janthinobacterium lividum]